MLAVLVCGWYIKGSYTGWMLSPIVGVIYGADHDIMYVAAYSNGHVKVYELLDPLELKTWKAKSMVDLAALVSVNCTLL
ncbi:unnamed protein product [Camellia sinensis]